MIRALRRAVATAIGAALAAAALVSTPAQAVTRDDCLKAGNVWVVVQPSASQTLTGCATDLSSGAAALKSAGFTPDSTSFITQINGLPAQPSNGAYWSYWNAVPNHRGNFSGYAYSQLGASASRPEPGSIEVWKYVSLALTPEQATPTLPLPANLPAPKLPGDRDGNGQADVVAVTNTGLLWQYSVRGARASSPYKVGHGWQDFTWIQLAPDLNGDRVSDLVGRRSDGSLWLYAGKGSEFAPGVRIGSGWNVMTMMLVVSDVTGDGRPEVIGRRSDGRLMRYSFASPTSFRPPVQLGTGWNGIRQLTSVGDFSGDGAPDLLAINSANDLVRYTFSRTGAISSTRKVGSNWGSMGLISSAGDATRDGRRDLFALRDNGTLWVYPTASPGTWQKPIQLTTGVTGIRMLA